MKNNRQSEDGRASNASLRLSEVTDIYVHESDPELGLVFPGSFPPIDNKEILQHTFKILDLCRFEVSNYASRNNGIEPDDFSLTFSGMFFRCNVIRSVGGKVFKLRRIPSEIEALSNLGIPPQLLSFLDYSTFLENGLLLISGGHGQGKSTTASSIVHRRLSRFGGVCITAEDPPEFPLQGPHGKNGYCYQVPVEHGRTFSDVIKSAMRSYPVDAFGIILVGEIRDSDTAVEAIQAGLNGRLVIGTIHSNNLIDALSRLEAMAASSMGVNEVRMKISSGFRMGIHQRLDLGSSGKNSTLRTNTLLSTSQVYSALKDGKYDSLKTEEERQRSLFLSGKEKKIMIKA